ncbi:nuclear transport factor 2 family protein [Lacinutrix algicola]|uniref:nuclear transport factor 2 family protein n=1 Tax=Lacinutrix algicola TaxID=342954 RepID=UPI0006E1ADA5|nr:nuclear transport factor 2 family protein [Lacinutrix algicola]
MSAKKVVKAFYDSNLAKDEDIISMFHEDCVLHWNSSQGFTTLNKDGILEKLQGVKESYLSFAYRLSHLLEDGDTVTARYTIYCTTIERPFKEEPLAHFISIWEVKDGKMYRGYEISQRLDESVENLTTFSEIKI